ncbi:MAG: sigma factor-like helix-turn-helix DNA-binding protein, partial [Leadbetterella sp.]|nr:sigma factor-like helix-turn-helix DNA-binding protein [Leadbetterella sp.]
HIIRVTLKEMGWSQKEMAEYLTQKSGVHVSQQLVNRWVTLRDFPKNEFIMNELEALCGCSREDLFPKFVRDKGFQRMIKFERRLEFDPDKFSVLLGVRRVAMPLPPDLELIRIETDSFVNEILSSLPKKEEMVVRKHFGLCSDSPIAMTLEEIGKELGVNKERVRQIEAEALLRIRRCIHRNGSLADRVDYSTENQDPLSRQILEQNLKKEMG